MKAKLHNNNISTYFNEIYIENELNNAITTIDNFNILIQEKEIEFNKYIDILNSLYNIELTNYDLLKICNIIFNKPCKSIILNTNIKGIVTNQIEKNNKFKYEDKEYLLEINVAFTDEQNIDINHKYNISEINKLIDERKIIVLDFIADNNSYYESNELYPLNYIVSEGFLSLKKINKLYISSTTKFLNNYFTIGKLKNDLNEYINELKEKLIYLDKLIEETTTGYKSKIKKYNRLSLLTNEIRNNENK